VHKRELSKPDGRRLILYGRDPIPEGIVPTSPSADRVPGRPSLRWHPLRGEWVAYATHRQERTFLPPPEYNPLAPTRDPAHPTELPSGQYDAAVFENRFASLGGAGPAVGEADGQAGAPYIPTRPAEGTCEVVVFTQDPTTSLGALPLWNLELLIEVWADRYRELGRRADVQYVMPFENRGVEVGVTLHHPHGQIYAYPFVPPIPAHELEQQRRHLEGRGRGLLEVMVAEEAADGRRLLYHSADALAFVPVCARYTYEAWVLPRRPAGSLADLDAGERRELARALKTVLMKYDRLWQRPFPYLMVFHQAPTDGQPHPEAHAHVELYPAYRSPDRLKYLAGTEIGAGMFANDSLPEAKAAELRAVEVNVD
jgi:UDPglucose--hexose-1-phosphate uridylyltransferase